MFNQYQSQTIRQINQRDQEERTRINPCIGHQVLSTGSIPHSSHSVIFKYEDGTSKVFDGKDWSSQ